MAQVNEAPKYFENIGFPLPANCNPADFYLDLCQGAVPRKGYPSFEWPELFDLWEAHRTQKGNGSSFSTTGIAVIAGKNSTSEVCKLFKFSLIVLHNLTDYYCH